MTPSTAHELLYNEIVPVGAVQREHDQLRQVLQLVSETVELEDVLRRIAGTTAGRRGLAARLAGPDRVRRREMEARWAEADPIQVVRDCVIGFRRTPGRLSELVARDRFVTPPLPNLYFTRDAGFVVHGWAYRSAMASPVRSAETALVGAALTELGFDVSEAIDGPEVSVEGGDVLVVDGDTVLLGMGRRSSAAGLDRLLAHVSRGRTTPLTALVVTLPDQRATIHLDMIATFVDHDTVLAYEPMVVGATACPVHEVRIDPGVDRWRIREHRSLVDGLTAIGRPMRIIPCGGREPVVREREQWFSACNSIALGPGHVVVYRNNPATLEALTDAGFDVVDGDEVIAHPERLVTPTGALAGTRTAVAVDGVELARGGGGPRCMTMPLDRDRG